MSDNENYVKWGSNLPQREHLTATHIPGSSGSSKRTVYAGSLCLFLCLLAVYWYSVPLEQNQQRAGFSFFGNDDIWIIGQFKAGETFTYSDHLAYHLLARILYNSAEFVPFLNQDAWVVHKLLSVFFGALGVAILFVIGARLTGSVASSFFAAMFVAGSASYWFFSATVDTYSPALCFSILALGVAIKCLRDQKPTSYFLLGITAGVAFLFRIDSILLVVLGLVLFGTRQRFWLRSSTLVSGWVVTVSIFYAVLSFNLPSEWDGYNIFSTALIEREGQMKRRGWGSVENLSGKNLVNVAFNHGAINVIAPEVERISSKFKISKIVQKLTLLLYSVAIIGVLYMVLFRPPPIGKNEKKGRNILLLIAAAWLSSRILLYTWWSPGEPFLFAILSLPALWLILLVFQMGSDRRLVKSALFLGFIAMIWSYNYFYFIAPYRTLVLNEL